MALQIFGGGASASSLAGTFAPAGALPRNRGAAVLNSAPHIRRALAKIAAARFTQCDIGVYGHSIVAGVGADDTVTTNETAWQTQSYARQLGSLFADRYGDPGEGFLWLGDSIGGRYATAAGAAKNGPNTSLGYAGFRGNMTGTTQTFTITTPVCTRIDVHYQGLQGGGFYSIDGGADVAIPTGAVELMVASITGLSDATHTLVLKGPASGSLLFSGINCRRTTTKGVVVHRLGYQGKVAADCWADAQPAGNVMANFTQAVKDRQRKSVTNAFGVDLAILHYDCNDVTGGWTTYALTPAQVKANVQNLVTRMVADTDIDILLVTGPERQPGTYSAGGNLQADYAQAYKDIAAATDRVAHLDLTAANGGYTTATADGLYADAVHPSLRGHSDIARTIFQALAG